MILCGKKKRKEQKEQKMFPHTLAFLFGTFLCDLEISIWQINENPARHDR